jgi:thioredoxin 1
MDPFLVIVALVILAAFTMRFAMDMRMKRKVGLPIPDVSAVTGRDLGADERALFYFYGSHCHACKHMTPIVKAEGEKRNNVFAVNISEHAKLARDFGLAATPTVIMVENGRISEIRVGAQSQMRLQQLFSQTEEKSRQDE